MRIVGLAPLMLVAMTAAAAPPLGPSFISDDYERARTQAAAKKLPLFVEVWAPW